MVGDNCHCHQVHFKLPAGVPVRLTFRHHRVFQLSLPLSFGVDDVLVTLDLSGLDSNLDWSFPVLGRFSLG